VRISNGSSVRYGCRFKYGGGAVVLSADARHNENVIRYGTGADLVVREVARIQ
jgi:ribonuclease Z